MTRTADSQLPRALHARGRDESVSLRLSGDRRRPPLFQRAGRAIRRTDFVRCGTASIGRRGSGRARPCAPSRDASATIRNRVRAARSRQCARVGVRTIKLRARRCRIARALRVETAEWPCSRRLSSAFASWRGLIACYASAVPSPTLPATPIGRAHLAEAIQYRWTDNFAELSPPKLLVPVGR